MKSYTLKTLRKEWNALVKATGRYPHEDLLRVDLNHRNHMIISDAYQQFLLYGKETERGPANIVELVKQLKTIKVESVWLGVFCRETQELAYFVKYRMVRKFKYVPRFAHTSHLPKEFRITALLRCAAQRRLRNPSWMNWRTHENTNFLRNIFVYHGHAVVISNEVPNSFLSYALIPPNEFGYGFYLFPVNVLVKHAREIGFNSVGTHSGHIGLFDTALALASIPQHIQEKGATCQNKPRLSNTSSPKGGSKKLPVPSSSKKTPRKKASPSPLSLP